ncbi:MAG: serine hydrolase domain-containing protein [Candidatus Promineifilaceae bacterium]|jgi:CubicO group peptidase (beta-lactamase class C family)
MLEQEQSKWDQICAYTDEIRLQYDVPGAALGILYNGEVKAAGFGITNVDNPLEVTDHTLFQVGSISKTFTGTLIMKLVEEGVIDLDAPVRTYLPEFKVADEEASEKVTVRHLMIHTSDWFGDYFLDTGAGDDAAARYVEAMVDLEQLAPLGEVWSYNNAGFHVLGLIIEMVSGKSFQELLRETVLDPLGLQNTFLDPGDVITYRFATGHSDGKVARPWPLPRAAYPVGGIVCDVYDLLAYARFHMGEGTAPNGQRILRKDSLSAMQTPNVTVWKGEKWGLTWAVDETYESRLVSHSGGTKGQISRLVLVPERDFAVAIFTNSESGGQVTRAVVRKALQLYLGIELNVPEAVEVPEEELAAFAGNYNRPYADIFLGMLGGRLVGRMVEKMGFPDKDIPPQAAPPPFTVGLVEEDRLMVLDGPMKSSLIDVIRKEDGSIGWLRAGRLHKRIE